MNKYTTIDIRKERKMTQARLRAWGKVVYNATHPCFFEKHPLWDIIDLLKKEYCLVIQEDGTKYEGILCGESGSARFELGDMETGYLVNNAVLVYEWFGKSVHGLDKIEINAYIS